MQRVKSEGLDVTYPYDKEPAEKEKEKAETKEKEKEKRNRNHSRQATDSSKDTAEKAREELSKKDRSTSHEKAKERRSSHEKDREQKRRKAVPSSTSPSPSPRRKRVLLVRETPLSVRSFLSQPHSSIVTHRNRLPVESRPNPPLDAATLKQMPREYTICCSCVPYRWLIVLQNSPDKSIPLSFRANNNRVRAHSHADRERQSASLCHRMLINESYSFKQDLARSLERGKRVVSVVLEPVLIRTRSLSPLLPKDPGSTSISHHLKPPSRRYSPFTSFLPPSLVVSHPIREEDPFDPLRQHLYLQMLFV